MPTLIASAPHRLLALSEAATQAGEPTIWQSLGLLAWVGVGIGVLLCVLLVLEITRSYRRLQATGTPAAQPPAAGPETPPAAVEAPRPVAAEPVAVAASTPPAAPPAAEVIPMTLVAAAIAAALDEPFRILAVRPVDSAWSAEGRRQHFASHQLLRAR